MTNITINIDSGNPVGAIKATVGLSGFIVPYLKVLTAVW